MPLRDEAVRAHLRALQLLWAVMLGGLGLTTVLAVAAAQLWPPLLQRISVTVFYTSALINLAALIWAFAMQYHVRTAIQRQTSHIARIAVAQELGQRAIVPLAAAGFFAAASAFATREWIHLAFLLPIFAFGGIFFPTDRRAVRFLRLPDEPAPPSTPDGA